MNYTPSKMSSKNYIEDLGNIQQYHNHFKACRIGTPFYVHVQQGNYNYNHSHYLFSNIF